MWLKNRSTYFFNCTVPCIRYTNSGTVFDQKTFNYAIEIILPPVYGIILACYCHFSHQIISTGSIRQHQWLRHTVRWERQGQRSEQLRGSMVFLRPPYAIDWVAGGSWVSESGVHPLFNTEDAVSLLRNNFDSVLLFVKCWNIKYDLLFHRGHDTVPD